MKKNLAIDDIRRLVDRWYAGLTDADEERVLKDALFSTPFLPPDLQKERELMTMLSEEWEVEMPQEYDLRLTAAIEKEMATNPVKTSAMGSFFNRRFWIRSLSGVAACLAIAFAAHQVWNAPDIEMQSPDVKVAMNISQPVASYDSLSMRALTIDTQEKSEKTYTTNSRKSINPQVSHRNRIKPVEKTSEEEYADVGYLSAAEEERLARNNYHVVRDASEADDILHSIFSRMENTMAMESSRISKIELEYDSEMSRLTKIDNKVEQYKEPYHDETPL